MSSLASVVQICQVKGEMKKLILIAKQPQNLTINFLILKRPGRKATSPSMNPPSIYVIAVFTSVLHCALNTPVTSSLGRLWMFLCICQYSQCS